MSKMTQTEKADFQLGVIVLTLVAVIAASAAFVTTKLVFDSNVFWWAFIPTLIAFESLAFYRISRLVDNDKA